MAKIINIGSKTWSTKKEAEAFYRAILHASTLNAPLEEEDFHEVYSLLLNHPSAQEKIQGGVEYLYVGNDEHGGRCFHIKHPDGTSEAFSFLKSISGESSGLSKFDKAARKAVEEDTSSHKRKYFGEEPTAVCELTGVDLMWAGAHVDHAPPNYFSTIVSSFLTEYGVDPSTEGYTSKTGYGCEFTNPKLAECFREFHNSRAKLRVICKKKNMAMAHLARR